MAWSALGANDNNRHQRHDGIVFDVFDPEGTHAATMPRDEVPDGGKEIWGDIFSHTKGTTRSHNWTTEGEAIFNGVTFQLSDGVTRTACKSMSIQEYIDSEVDAGVSLEDVMADLDDQESSEDLAVKNALGGSFSSWYASLPPGQQNAASVNAELTAATPTVSTNDATDVTELSATLPGVSDPEGVPLTFRFEYSTDPALIGASTWDTSMTVNGSATTTSNASSSVNVASPLTGLSPGTTYYFELVGMNTSGSGDDEVSTDVRGGIKSFTTPAVTTTTAPTSTTTTTAAPTSTTTTTTTTAAPTSTTTAPATTVPVLARVTPLECGTLDPRNSSDSPTESIDVSLRETGGSGSQKGGTISITQPDDGPPVELVEVTSSDPTVKVSVVSSGADYNKPSTWQDQGFGQECWKIEPFGDGDYRYLLPLTPQPPSGRTPSYYSIVKVKAGSITSTDPNFQVNTVFPTPAGGMVVFADSNGNGISDAGGRNGDKSISHVIICVIYGEPPKPATAPSPTSSTTTPTTSSSVASSLAPPTTPAPTLEDCPTVPTVPTTVPSTPGTTIPGSSGTTVPGSSSTTIPGSSGTTVPGAPTTATPSTVPGPLEKPMRFRVIVPKSSNAKIVTFNVKFSSGFRQYSMPLKVDVRTFKLRKEILPVSGGENDSGRALFALLLIAGALSLRAARKMREEGSRR